MVLNIQGCKTLFINGNIQIAINIIMNILFIKNNIFCFQHHFYLQFGH